MIINKTILLIGGFLFFLLAINLAYYIPDFLQNQEKTDFNLFKVKKHLHFEKIVNLTKQDIFLSMANVEDYPKILPNNVREINIINSTDNVIFAKERVGESIVEIEFLVKHELIPFERQTIEILSGDAKGTNITIIFKDVDSGTQISTDVEMRITGPIAIFVSTLHLVNLHSAMNTLITAFEEYTKNQLQ